MQMGWGVVVWYLLLAAPREGKDSKPDARFRRRLMDIIFLCSNTRRVLCCMMHCSCVLEKASDCSDMVVVAVERVIIPKSPTHKSHTRAITKVLDQMTNEMNKIIPRCRLLAPSPLN
uniref:Putative secreted protein n=1 Tax=Anopheles darlingi TaxID=43151 RepID=A0A2M4DIX1_ANODA